MKNYKKYKTMEDRLAAFRKFCERHDCQECPARNGDDDHGFVSECALIWLELDCSSCEAPLEKCPNCGSAPRVAKFRKMFAVCCDKCGARGPLCKSEEDAKIAWNKVMSRK